jgi:hypothetical protein
MSEYRENHYVACWYQERFMPETGEKKLHLLDMKPEDVKCGDGIVRKRKNILRWGTKNCFVERDLYTVFLGEHYSTEIEKRFFGLLDTKAPPVFNAICSFEHTNTDPAVIRFLLNFMSTQRLRTPAGLRSLKAMYPSYDKNRILSSMQQLKSIYCAIWSECIWSIVSAENASIKFIISDHPVTFYNSHCNPNSVVHRMPPEVDLRKVGTHTVFPLSSTKCLVLTHLSWVRNPFQDPNDYRPNPKYFRNTLFNLLDIQVGRELTDIEVCKFNYVIKNSAYRYIAAKERSWLFPEQSLGIRSWDTFKLEDLFMPDPRPCGFHTETIIGNNSGFVDGVDEYGRRPYDAGYSNESRRRQEFRTFEKAKAVFAEKHGPKRKGRNYTFSGLSSDEDSNSEHQRYLQYLRK